MIAESVVSAYPVPVASFGENLRALRERAHMTQEDVMRALGLKRSAPVSLMEAMRGSKVPRPRTIEKVAVAVKAEPWELLEGVETELDQLRNRRDLLRHSDRVQSPIEGDHGENDGSHIGTKRAGASASPPSGKAPNAEARLREENDQLRSALEVIAKALVGLGAPKTPKGPAMASQNPGRSRRAR